jgi:signal transduction histidine kinase/ActR/RegA family two-component response regulator
MRTDEAPVARPRGKILRLQTQVGLALGGLVFLTAMVLAFLLSSAAEGRVLRISAQNLENLSGQMARELSAGMDTFLRDVQDQAVRDRFTSPTSSVASLRTALDQFKQNHPEFAYVSIVDVDTRKVIAASGGIFEGGDASGRPTFEQGKIGPFLGDVHDAVRLAELLPKPAQGEALRFLDVAAPIRDPSGKVIRVFASHVGWEWTASVRDHVFGPVSAQRGTDAFIVDTSGKVVMSGVPDVRVGTDLRALAGTRGREARRIEWPDGRPYLTTVAPVAPRGGFSGFGWTVVARQPYEAAYAPARDLRNAFLLGALGLGLGAALLAWLLTGRLTRPVRALAEAARAAGGGSFQAIASTGRVGEVQEVARAMTTLSDSARRQAEAADTRERQFALLAGSLPQVVWEADASGVLQYVNKAWIRERVDAPATIAGLDRVVHLDDCEAFNSAWRASLATGDTLKVRCRLHIPGEPQPIWHDIEARAVRAPGGPVVRWIGTMFDVNDGVLAAERTERRLAQERSAREEAERLSRMRDEFMATVSHELRSPLSAITGWSDILARKANTDETLTKAAQVIRRNALLQAQLIDDLLDMTAVIAGKLTLNASVFDLSMLARDVTLSHLHSAQQKGVALQWPEATPTLVQGDARRVSQVLSNLIANAVKFTDAGGRVEVSMWTDAGSAGVKVKDTGRGIAPSFLPHVFERLRQEDASKTRRAGGLGIGLAIAKAVVELHHGTIEAHSAGPGAGAEFTFTLPLADAESQVPPVPEDAGGAAGVDVGDVLVLLVDDEKDAREVGQIALASMGAHVKVAGSAAEALRMAERECFDVVVSDIGMPGMDGLAFVRALRAGDSPNANVPAVALSAFALESEQAEGLAAGFDAYVTKPISLRRLGEGVKLAQRRRRATRKA